MKVFTYVKDLRKFLLFLFGSNDYLLGLAVLRRHHIHADDVASGDVGYLGVIDHLAVNLQDIFLLRCGSISNARVVKSVNPELDAEALRVVNSMPNWNPGKQDGKAVRVKYTVPVTFKLDAAALEEKYILEIDGKVVDDSEIANIPSGDVVSIDAVPAQNGQPKKIRITTKKKQ